MKLSTSQFRGMHPIIGNSKLPNGYASNAVNTKLVSGDIQGYLDIGNPFQLSKPAPIFTLAKAANEDWLQFSQNELASFAFDIHAIPGTVAADPTGRRYITGYNALTSGASGVFQGPSSNTSVPQFTNTYYATDPSQRGSAAVGAFPYKTFALGVPNPTTIPSVSVPSASGVTNGYEFAQEASVNNAILNAAGSAYSAGDVLTVVGGTLSNNLPAATIQVQTVTSSGGVATFIILTGGFYQAGLGPPATAATVTGGTGTGATFDLTTVPISFTGFTPFSPGNGGDFYTHWTLTSNKWQCTAAQGGLRVCYSNGAFNLIGASAYTAQMDAALFDNGSGEYSQLALYLSGAPTGSNVGGVFTGPAVVLTKSGTFALCSKVVDDNGDSLLTGGTVIVSQQTGLSISASTFYRISATLTAQTTSSTPGYSVTVTLATQAAPSSIIATLNGFVPYVGESIAVAMNHTHTGDSDRHQETAQFENVYITVTQPASSLTEEFTNYVTTYVQQIPLDLLTQESGPSDPSDTVGVTINTTVNPAIRATATLTIQPVPAGEYIAYINLYRLVTDAAGNETYTLVTVLGAFALTGASGTFTAGSTVTDVQSGATATVVSYSGGVLVVSGVTGLFQQGDTIQQSAGISGTYASSALSSTTITYRDSASDTAIGPDTLISADWAPPPANMQGLIALPNGIMAGFFDNVLCLSAQGYPHAWPVANQYSIDTPIRDISAIDTTILIVDEANPYTAWGTDPSAFNMSKESSTQGCQTTRGVVTHKRFGVVFPSSNGIAFYRGQGQLDLVRIGESNQPPFSYEQWRALNPSSIHAVMHDDHYFFWYDNGSVKGGFVLDLEPSGFGLHALDFHVTESYVDTTTDSLYLVPDFSLYNINDRVVLSPTNVVSQWEAAATYRPRTWERDEWLLMRPASFARARVRYTTGVVYTFASNGAIYNTFTYNSVVYNAPPSGSLTPIPTGSLALEITSEQGLSYNNAVSRQSMFVIGNKGAAIRWNTLLTMTGDVVVNSLEVSETASDMLEGA